MRKYSLVLSAVAVTGLTVAAQAAPESVYYFDIRPTAASITTPVAPFTIGQGDFPDDGGAGGGKGNGQVLRVSPILSGGQHISTPAAYPAFDDNDASTGDLWLYADVLPNADSPLGTNDVISSIGLDMAISTSAATPRFEIGSVAWTWSLAANANSGVANGTSSRTGVVGAKYVMVPVSPASTYATTGGLTPSGTSYQLGKLRITGAARNAVSCATANGTHATNSTYTVNMSVNNLLITRTFSTGGNAVPEERVSFGYNAGAIDTDVSGNTVGGAGVRDAVIQVRLKHDGNGSGNVNTLDIPGVNGFNAAQTAGAGINQRQRYLFDRNNASNVNTLDIAGPNGFNGLQATVCP
jgi:hypothetical protein